MGSARNVDKSQFKGIRQQRIETAQQMKKLFISWVVSIRWRKLLLLEQRFHSKETLPVSKPLKIEALRAALGKSFRQNPSIVLPQMVLPLKLSEFYSAFERFMAQPS
ncbi:hypothetical protein EDS67_06235 [candidate division KSB1 bacterium]|nr:MAG: hypothetical protein EDS67_06235 [candidate division KSB1 bacterium]MBC6947711.1 hypothetical protein [candidate division KSB1 bacterium]MCE7940260.1 hypothetical protein [Chlorobi bacterium CHB1]